MEDAAIMAAITLLQSSNTMSDTGRQSMTDKLASSMKVCINFPWVEDLRWTPPFLARLSEIDHRAGQG